MRSGMASAVAVSVGLLSACESAPYEVVDSHAVAVLESERGLGPSCVSLGRVEATEVSWYAFNFLRSYEGSEAVAIGMLGSEAIQLGGDTVVLDRDAFAEVIGLDVSRDYGVHAEGTAYLCGAE